MSAQQVSVSACRGMKFMVPLRLRSPHLCIPYYPLHMELIYTSSVLFNTCHWLWNKGLVPAILDGWGYSSNILCIPRNSWKKLTGERTWHGKKSHLGHWRGMKVNVGYHARTWSGKLFKHKNQVFCKRKFIRDQSHNIKLFINLHFLNIFFKFFTS